MENKEQSNGETKEKAVKKKTVSEFPKSVNTFVCYLGTGGRK